MAAIGELDWVHVFVDLPADTVERTRAFWSRALGWPVGQPWQEHPEFTTLLPPRGRSYVHVQQVEDRPRVHVDLEVDDIDVARDRLVELGATAGMRTRWWQVMGSPGGLPFCLCTTGDEPRPGPAAWPEGHSSRLVQVCIDAPAPLFDRELAFWEHATGWRRERSGREEFTDLVGPPEAPLRLLLQRLDPGDAGTTVRAHLDVGSDAVDAEAGRLGDLGARFVDRFPRWALLADPAGLPFCVIDRSPR
jgi:predicted enzyme related to lactoylglutathione lyase